MTKMRKDRPEREVREKREKSENLYLTLLIYKIDLAKSMPLNWSKKVNLVKLLRSSPLQQELTHMSMSYLKPLSNVYQKNVGIFRKLFRKIIGPRR